MTVHRTVAKSREVGMTNIIAMGSTRSRIGEYFLQYVFRISDADIIHQMLILLNLFLILVE
jgi:hypothetical protein